MWQYLLEIRVPFAILIAVLLVAAGYGACWLLMVRPSKKRALRDIRKVQSDAERQCSERVKDLLAQHNATVAQSAKRINDLEEIRRQLDRELSRQKAEIEQHRHRELAPPAARQQAAPPFGRPNIREQVAGRESGSTKSATGGVTGSPGGLARGPGGTARGPGGTVRGPAGMAARPAAERPLFVAYRITVTDDPGASPAYAWGRQYGRPLRVVVEYAEIPPDYSSGISEIIRLMTGSWDKLKDAVNEYTATKFVNATWKQVVERGVTPNPGVFDAAAQAVANFRNGVHDAILGEPVEAAANAVGLPPALSALGAGVIAEVPLPGDHSLGVVKRSIYMAEIVIGMLPPFHALAVHGVQGLTHDVAVGALKKGLAQLEAGPSRPPQAPPDPPDPSPTRPGPPPGAAPGVGPRKPWTDPGPPSPKPPTPRGPDAPGAPGAPGPPGAPGMSRF